jgi:hypothetical protein
MVNGNIFDAIRRNQALEKEKRLAQRKSFIDPSIQRVQGVTPINISQAIQLSRPVNIGKVGSIATTVSQRNRVATTNISPLEKNRQDLQRAFPTSVSQVAQRGSPRETEQTVRSATLSNRTIRGLPKQIPEVFGAESVDPRFDTVTLLSTEAGGERIIKGSRELQDRIAGNVARSRFTLALQGLQSVVNDLSSIFGGK